MMFRCMSSPALHFSIPGLVYRGDQALCFLVVAAYMMKADRQPHLSYAIASELATWRYGFVLLDMVSAHE